MTTGVLCQILVSYLLTRSMEVLRETQGTSQGKIVDERLEQLHSQMSIGFNAITMSYLFIISGMVFLLIGVYQTAKCVESIQSGQSQ